MSPWRVPFLAPMSLDLSMALSTALRAANGRPNSACPCRKTSRGSDNTVPIRGNSVGRSPVLAAFGAFAGPLDLLTRYAGRAFGAFAGPLDLLTRYSGRAFSAL